MLYIAILCHFYSISISDRTRRPIKIVFHTVKQSVEVHTFFPIRRYVMIGLSGPCYCIVVLLLLGMMHAGRTILYRGAHARLHHAWAAAMRQQLAGCGSDDDASLIHSVLWWSKTLAAYCSYTSYCGIMVYLGFLFGLVMWSGSVNYCRLLKCEPSRVMLLGLVEREASQQLPSEANP
jgi:hypothetical protein